MGIDRELISEFGKEIGVCKICTQLVEDPVVLKCDHFYCKKCIEKKIKEVDFPLPGEKSAKKMECPECEQEFNPNEDMKPPDLFMRQALSSIKLKCLLSGCAQIVTYDSFAAHIAECSFNPDVTLYKKRDEEDHITDCLPSMTQTVYDHFENQSPISKDWEHSIISTVSIISPIFGQTFWKRS